MTLVQRFRASEKINKYQQDTVWRKNIFPAKWGISLAFFEWMPHHDSFGWLTTVETISSWCSVPPFNGTWQAKWLSHTCGNVYWAWWLMANSTRTPSFSWHNGEFRFALSPSFARRSPAPKFSINPSNPQRRKANSKTLQLDVSMSLFNSMLFTVGCTEEVRDRYVQRLVTYLKLFARGLPSESLPLYCLVIIATR